MGKHKIPTMKVGKFAGVPVDQLPVSYCRWMLGQDFPEELLKVARRKVEASPISQEFLSVSRHVIDRYSQRFLHVWLKAVREKETTDGIATFLVKQAEEAWKNGEDRSKRRHQADGIIKEMNGISYVFNQSANFPEYRDLITVMEASEPLSTVTVDELLDS